MRQRPARYEVGSRLRELRNPAQRHAAGNLGLRTASAAAYSLMDLIDRHVIEQQDVGPGRERLIDLFERLDFNFYRRRGTE